MKKYISTLWINTKVCATILDYGYFQYSSPLGEGDSKIIMSHIFVSTRVRLTNFDGNVLHQNQWCFKETKKQIITFKNCGENEEE